MDTELQHDFKSEHTGRVTRRTRPPVRPKMRRWDRLRNLDDPWMQDSILVGMQVWTEEELAQHAKVSSEQVRAWIEAGLPTLPTTDGAVRISEAAFDAWAKEQGGRRDRLRGGRRDETSSIAEFILELRGQDQDWKTILKACRGRWPDDPRVQNAEQLRGTYRRYAKRTRTQSD